MEAEVQESDLPHLFLIGSPDLQETFGAYRIADISRDMSGDDRYRHRIRVRSLARAAREGRALERPILVSDSVVGPYVFIDGNHRALALHAGGLLSGLQVYLGTARQLLRRYDWARSARVG